MNLLPIGLPIASITGTIFFAFRLKIARARRCCAAILLSQVEETRALSIQSLFGYNEHSFVGVSVQSKVWFDEDHNGAVCYNERGRMWIVGGEPLGCEKDIPAITNAFIRHARSNRKIVAFLPTTEKFARSITERGTRIAKVGASPYFDLQNWNPRGNSAKKLRLGVNRGRNAGISVEPVLALTADFRDDVDRLRKEWANSRRAGVHFGWLFQIRVFQNWSSKKYFKATDKEGRLMGVLAASPIPARDGWYLEDVLIAADAPNGTSDLMVFETLKCLAAEGITLATLGTVPLSRKGIDDISSDRNVILDKILLFSREHLNSIYNFDGLGTFKSKFVPSWWECEYAVVSKGYFTSPRVAYAVFKLIIPGGIFKILQTLFFDVG